MDEDKRVKDIQKRFLTRLLMSKAGRVAEAFRLMKTIPEPIDLERRKRASKFEKGLSGYFERTVRKTFNAYKEEWEEGQAYKKRAAINLINSTMNKNKIMYTRWNLITEKEKLVRQCRLLSNVFSNINFAIKSVADNAFLNSKDNEVKEKALVQLFKNLYGNLGDTFRRWR